MEKYELFALARHLWRKCSELDLALHSELGTSGYRREDDLEEARIKLGLEDPLKEKNIKGPGIWRAEDHEEHHYHLNGTMVECSCDFQMGITTVAFGPDYNPNKLSCDVCGKVGVVRIPPKE